jgi:ATP diphosphatase
MPPTSFERLLEVISTLIGPQGCPWDIKQTPKSLCDYVIEEAFELVEAIRADDVAGAREELGDVLFLLMFIAKLYEREGAFGPKAVVEEIAAKMVRRHPHVFGDEEVVDAGEVLANWERIKRGEKQGEEFASIFDSLPRGLPPLLRAYRLASKAARTGYRMGDDALAADRLRADFERFMETEGEDAEEVFGELLIRLADAGRRKGLKANACLDLANQRFLARFQAAERLAHERGLDFAELSQEAKVGLMDEVEAKE